jgi:hypothetical protein
MYIMAATFAQERWLNVQYLKKEKIKKKEKKKWSPTFAQERWLSLYIHTHTRWYTY